MMGFTAGELIGGDKGKDMCSSYNNKDHCGKDDTPISAY